MRPSRLDSALKARLLTAIQSAENMDKLKRVIGAVYAFRRKEYLTFSQFQTLVEASQAAKTRLEPGAPPPPKGGA